MKKIGVLLSLLAIVAVIFLSAFDQPTTLAPSNSSFNLGEKVAYRVHYGIINAAEAHVDIAKTTTNVQGRPCYRINVFGRTTGAFDVFTKVRDTWRSYMDTTQFVPHQFYRNIRENSYKKEETTFFDQKRHIVTTKTKDTTRVFEVPPRVQDIVSGYYYLRTIDYNKMQVGDMIEVPVFLSDEVFKLRVKFAGRDVVKTKFGKIRVFKLNPLMPKNKMFKGENSIRIWVSDDANKIPIKVEVDMFIGALALDLKEYSGLKVEPKWDL